MSADPRIRLLESGTEAEARFTEALDRPVRVIVGGGEVSWARQLTVLCLVDLLGRLLPSLDIVCDAGARADDRLPSGPELLIDRISEARTFAMIEPLAEPAGDPVLTVVVGDAPGGDVYVDGAGWVSYLGDRAGEALLEDERNPIGPLAAACRGAAQVIGRLLGDLLPASTPVEASYWSALTLAPCDPADAARWPALSEPRVEALLMGGGSIGGATVYTLARVPGLSGSLPIVDFDRLEADNSRKALLARRVDIEAEEAKVRVAVAELADLPDLDAEASEETLAQWVAGRPADQPLPLVLCAVDSIPARRELADHMPLEALNAACGDTHIVVSGHRTDEGPCVYCLYVRDVLDTEVTRARMMVRELGLPDGMVVQLRVSRAPLEPQHLRRIEQRRELPAGALAQFRGRTVDELFDERILYGETRLEDDQGRRAALQLPFVPALAGVLLAGEALKRGQGAEFEPFRLGPGLATEYGESVLQAPIGLLSDPPRWPTSECLCRSQRRLELMRSRYGLAGP